MELPHMGSHCEEPSCKQLDYLPMKVGRERERVKRDREKRRIGIWS